MPSQQSILFGILFSYLLLVVNFAALSQAIENALYIVDENDRPLLGATVSTDQNQIAITDINGKVRLSCSCDTLKINISFIGYQIYESDLAMMGPETTIRLVPSEQIMQEVIVSGSSTKEQLNELSTGMKTINMESISQLPYLLGEQDPVKYIQTLPGVSTGADGNNGYYVRGGGIDQNKIMLDNIELYNTNHLFGFFSMFSGDAVDRVDFVKSGYSASEGGRLSSMLHVHSQNPNNNELTGSAGIGLLAAKLHLEVPVIKEQSSIMISGRKSYIDLITQNLVKEGSQLQRRTDYKFGDLMMKYQHQLSAKHQLSATGFISTDDYYFRNTRAYANAFYWKTSNAGISWKWLHSDLLSGEVYYTVGDYTQRFLADISGYNVSMSSHIKDMSAGSKNYLTLNRHEITFGLHSNWRSIRPNSINLSSEDRSTELTESQDIPSLESALFLDDEVSINNKWKLGIGLRISTYQQFGPFQRYRSTDNFIVTDTINYRRGEVAQNYFNLEPRLRVNHLISTFQSIRFSYDRTFQYIHLSPLSSVSLPTDVWVPSSEKVKPQGAHQFTLGYFQFGGDDDFQFSVNAFYKLLSNQMEYINGLAFGYNQGYNYDDTFIFGKGRSRGLEVFLQKEQGANQIQISYTLSKTERTFSAINNGKYFNSKYDRTHDLNILASHKSGSWTFSSVFKLATGNALTLPIAKYIIGGNVISEYGERNSFRMPLYHRIDLAASLVPRKHPKSTWVFSVYNTYNRNNPYYVYFDVQGNVNEYRLDIDLKKVALFPILPSIAYEFNF
ncbi:MAG: hypothetical protein ACI83W_000888 [Marinoscillum sp.]